MGRNEWGHGISLPTPLVGMVCLVMGARVKKNEWGWELPAQSMHGIWQMGGQGMWEAGGRKNEWGCGICLPTPLVGVVHSVMAWGGNCQQRA